MSLGDNTAWGGLCPLAFDRAAEWAEATAQGAEMAEIASRPREPDRAAFPGPEYHILGALSAAATGLQDFALIVNCLAQDHAAQIRKQAAEIAELRARVEALEARR
jgi:hypothetical protein